MDDAGVDLEDDAGHGVDLEDEDLEDDAGHSVDLANAAGMASSGCDGVDISHW